MAAVSCAGAARVPADLQRLAEAETDDESSAEPPEAIAKSASMRTEATTAASSCGPSEEAQRVAPPKPTQPSDDESLSLGSSEDEGSVYSPAHRPPSPGKLSTVARRRSGMQAEPREIFEGLKARFDAMEQLDVSPANAETQAIGKDDGLAYIRLLKPADFIKFLQNYEVPVEQYGRGKARCLRDLWAEVVIRECNLERAPEPSHRCGWALRRKVRILVLELSALVAGQERLLLLKEETNDYGGSRQNLDTRVTKKMFDDEDVPSAIGRCLLQTLGLDLCCAGDQHLELESAEDAEELRDSTAYPGLCTSYVLHVVRMRVREPSHPGFAGLGLPEGRDFTTQLMNNAVGVGKSRNWTWCSREAFEAAKEATRGTLLSPTRSRQLTLGQRSGGSPSDVFGLQRAADAEEAAQAAAQGGPASGA